MKVMFKEQDYREMEAVADMLFHLKEKYGVPEHKAWALYVAGIILGVKRRE